MLDAILLIFSNIWMHFLYAWHLELVFEWIHYKNTTYSLFIIQQQCPLFTKSASLNNNVHCLQNTTYSLKGRRESIYDKGWKGTQLLNDNQSQFLLFARNENLHASCISKIPFLLNITSVQEPKVLIFSLCLFNDIICLILCPLHADCFICSLLLVGGASRANQFPGGK